MPPKDKRTIKQLVDDIVADGKLTRQEKIRLDEAIRADGELDQEELGQLHRIMAMIRKGELEVVN